MRERSQESESRIQELDCFLFFILISKFEIRKSVARCQVSGVRCQVSAVNGKSLSRIEDFKSLNFLIPNLQSKIYNLQSTLCLQPQAQRSSNLQPRSALCPIKLAVDQNWTLLPSQKKVPSPLDSGSREQLSSPAQRGRPVHLHFWEDPYLVTATSVRFGFRVEF
jgi:hypothetical protein